jgi:hypothetical protein
VSFTGAAMTTDTTKMRAMKVEINLNCIMSYDVEWGEVRRQRVTCEGDGFFICFTTFALAIKIRVSVFLRCMAAERIAWLQRNMVP